MKRSKIGGKNMTSMDIFIKMMLITIVMLLMVTVLGLMSVANACEISDHKYRDLGDGTNYVNHSLQEENVYLFSPHLLVGFESLAVTA
jgi:hypothetical protein